MGLLTLLQQVYPGGETEFSRDSVGHAVVYFYRVSARQAAQAADALKGTLKPNMGLTGIYRRTLNWNSPPSLVHADPLINFTFRNDFPVDQFPPLSVWWTGQLEIPKTGTYQFLFLTTDQAKLKIGKETVLSSSNRESGNWFFKKGPQKINVFFQKSKGVDTALSLLWMKPGDGKFEVIPYSAFRRNPSLNR